MKTKKKYKGSQNIFPNAQNGKGSKRRQRDDEAWEKADYWKSTEHYKRHRWAYEPDGEEQGE